MRLASRRTGVRGGIAFAVPGKGKYERKSIMKKLIIAVMIAAIGCGCITVNKNDGGESDLKMRICKDVIHEKVSVGDKQVSAKDNLHCLFGLICWGSTASHDADLAEGSEDSAKLFGFMAAPLSPMQKAKNGAYANACDAAKCDQLVATRYKVTAEDYYVYTKYTAEVTGYPAKVDGVEVVVPPCMVKPATCCPCKK